MSALSRNQLKRARVSAAARTGPSFTKSQIYKPHSPSFNHLSLPKRIEWISQTITERLRDVQGWSGTRTLKRPWRNHKRVSVVLEYQKRSECLDEIWLSKTNSDRLRLLLLSRAVRYLKESSPLPFSKTGNRRRRTPKITLGPI